ncbi:unnamed protein product [Lactuca virosa]|uniref:Uncharacterized protein n=1 Tax=Lactuca virosa TaxID=75947 RepID=A0AAU9P2L7_9ASTR|nr:unnamed protein product [Lactuca virosa]
MFMISIQGLRYQTPMYSKPISNMLMVKCTSQNIFIEREPIYVSERGITARSGRNEVKLIQIWNSAPRDVTSLYQSDVKQHQLKPWGTKFQMEDGVVHVYANKDCGELLQ